MLHFAEASEIAFFKKSHKWTEELRIGQRKGYSMGYCDTQTLLLASQFKMSDRRIKLKETQLLLDVAQHCSVFFFPCRNFYAENFVILFYEIKLLFTSLKSALLV